MSRPHLACLLPARNCKELLGGYFESVRRFADVVVALDDGSTDETRELLASEPLVRVLLSNPVRRTYAGWDDGANRNRLLEATGELQPRWILSLDADERLDASDADALLCFLEDQALPDEGYRLQRYRMVGSLGQYDLAAMWVGRLFAWERGQRFPVDRLHFEPLPTSIPLARRRRTTLRIQHLASLDEERRRVRLVKYLQADPGHDHQATYRNLLAPPGRPWPWWTRSDHLPPLANTRDLNPPRSAPGTPSISAIVLCANGEDGLHRAVRSVVDQQCPEPFEVIVVTRGPTEAPAIHREFATVKVVKAHASARPEQMRNAGLQAARGTHVSFVDSDMELSPGELATRLEAHQLGYAMVSGTVLNGALTRSGWASYFLDNAAELPGGPSGELGSAPRRCSYLRSALIEMGGFPEDFRVDEEAVVNKMLFRRGYGGYRVQDLCVVHHGPYVTPWLLARHQFELGRATGHHIAEDAQGQARLSTRWMLSYVALDVPRRFRSVASNVRHTGDGTRNRFLSTWPLVLLGAVARWLGGCWEIAGRLPGMRRELQRVLGGSVDQPQRQAPMHVSAVWSMLCGSRCANPRNRQGG